MKLLPFILTLCLFCLSCSKKETSTQPIVGENTITALDKYTTVSAMAAARDSSLRLLGISGSDVDSLGRSQSWSYMYCRNVLPEQCAYFTAFHDSVRFDSLSSGILIGIAMIGHTWMNSNQALQIAESNQGKTFRQSFPSCVVYASLREPVVPNTTTYWYVTYRSKTDATKSLSLTIDANTGKIS